ADVSRADTHPYQSSATDAALLPSRSLPALGPRRSLMPSRLPASALWEAICRVSEADGLAGVAPLCPISGSETLVARSAHSGGRASRVEFDGDLLSPFSSSHGSSRTGEHVQTHERSFLRKNESIGTNYGDDPK